MKTFLGRNASIWMRALMLSAVVLLLQVAVIAQSASGSLTGTVVDPHGQAVPSATIVVTNNANGSSRQAVADAEGRFTVANLADGSYTVEISAPGLSVVAQKNIHGAETITGQFKLSVAAVSEDVLVQAEETNSLSSQLAPIKALLDMTSARTEITNNYIRNYASPLADFTELVQAVPGTFSSSSDGVGLGQSNTAFRGFSDGEYSITYDGIPFEDTNSPTHHSWAFFPAGQIGSVDFDRSPGSASDVGPTNFGGSIHLISPVIPSKQGFTFDDSFGSFGTNWVNGTYSSGLFGGANPKGRVWFDASHLYSNGYQTQNIQIRSDAALKFEYKASEKILYTLFASVVIVDSNTPNNQTTTWQLANIGKNYLLDKTQYYTDGVTVDPQWYRFYFYHVPTSFVYGSISDQLSAKWKLDSKAYTYGYSNHQHYLKSTAASTVIDPLTASEDTPLYLPTISKKGGIDKLNQYEKMGEITSVSYAAPKYVIRFGAWYEWAATNRYQVKSNPLTWVDLAGYTNIKFHEHFITNSLSPYAEFQYVGIPKWTINVGVKDAYYNMYLKQYQDGSTVGSLNGAPYVTHDANYNNFLPYASANYRWRNNVSFYGQFGMGSVIPPSSVFDTTNAAVAATPKPTVATTIQGGTVVKLNRFSFDADVYHIHFDNTYSSYTDSNGDQQFFATAPSNTTGVEGEGSIALGHGLTVLLNSTLDSAKYDSYSGNSTAGFLPTPSAWVAGAPHDTESEGITYQSRSWNIGFFNKRVGSQWNDNSGPTPSATAGAANGCQLTDTCIPLIHQAIAINPFSIANFFLNYTVNRGSRFDGTKLRFGINNLLNDKSVTTLTPGTAGTSLSSPYLPSSILPTSNPSDYYANGTAVGTPDIATTNAGRSFMVSIQFAFNPKPKE